MFVRYYTELSHPAVDVEQALVKNGLQRWLQRVIEEGSTAEGQLLAQVGFDVAGRRVAKRGLVTISDPVRRGSTLVVPIEWKAAEHTHLFPSVEADLEIASLGSTLTQVSLSALYEPPFGAIGSALDRALLHRVAEAVVRDTTERIAEVLKAELSSGAASSPSAGPG